MIDRALVAKIAEFAIDIYDESMMEQSDAVLLTVDQFTLAEPTVDEVEAEIDAINAMYLAQTARQGVVHWMRESWARERIAWRKHMEANSR